jgi:hypothetical protein
MTSDRLRTVPRADITVLVPGTWDAAGPELAAVDRIAPDRRYGLDSRLNGTSSLTRTSPYGPQILGSASSGLSALAERHVANRRAYREYGYPHRIGAVSPQPAAMNPPARPPTAPTQ